MSDYYQTINLITTTTTTTTIISFIIPIPAYKLSNQLMKTIWC